MPESSHSLVDSLIFLGLRPNEALVYGALVEVGPCFVAPLVRRTKKHRQIVYNALDTLSRRHLVTVGNKRGKNFYAIGDPRGLVADLKQREHLATDVAERVEKRLKTAGERVDVFSGPDSFANGLADFRRRAEDAGEYTVIGGEPEDWFEYLQPVFAAHVDEVRRLKRLGVPVRILFFETERASALKHIGPLVGDPYTLKISAAQPKLPHTAWLAGDHVYVLTPTADPLVTHIQSPPLAREYRKYFEMVWREAERIPPRRRDSSLAGAPLE